MSAVLLVARAEARRRGRRLLGLALLWPWSAPPCSARWPGPDAAPARSTGSRTPPTAATGEPSPSCWGADVVDDLVAEVGRSRRGGGGGWVGDLRDRRLLRHRHQHPRALRRRGQFRRHRPAASPGRAPPRPCRRRRGGAERTGRRADSTSTRATASRSSTFSDEDCAALADGRLPGLQRSRRRPRGRGRGPGHRGAAGQCRGVGAGRHRHAGLRGRARRRRLRGRRLRQRPLRATGVGRPTRR